MAAFPPPQNAQSPQEPQGDDARANPRMRPFRRRFLSWHGALPAVVLAGALALTGCTGVDGDGAEDADAGGQPQETSAQAEPAIVEDDGFWRANTLPEPLAEAVFTLPSAQLDGEAASAQLQVLSLDSDGEFARMVLAWLPPADGAFLGSERLAAHEAIASGVPFVRLVDTENGELIEPLRSEHGGNFDASAPPQVQDAGEDDAVNRAGCICSYSAGKDEAAAGQPDQTELIFLDFPAPQGAAVEVFAGEWHEPLPDVPVSQSQPFEFPDDGLSGFTMVDVASDRPGEVYGGGARYARTTALTGRSESLTGVSTARSGETQEVSLPSDVLFEFDSDELDSDAQRIVGEVAQKLNAEAAGQTVVIEGHTDNQGAEDYNQDLSERRAQSVAEEISGQLDDGITVETEGHGMSRPLVPNTDAAGEAIPQNQQRNRRVGFRYTAVEDSGNQIDLGFEGLEELPQAEETETAEGAQASYLLAAPDGDSSGTAVRFDVLDASSDGEHGTLRVAFADPDGGTATEVFQGNPLEQDDAHFGRNPFGFTSAPGMNNISLVDVSGETMYYPVNAGAEGCLCTEVAGTGRDLFAQGSPMFARFQLPEAVEGPLVLRVPAAGQFELPESVVQQLTGGR